MSLAIGYGKFSREDQTETAVSRPRNRTRKSVVVGAHVGHNAISLSDALHYAHQGSEVSKVQTL